MIAVNPTSPACTLEFGDQVVYLNESPSDVAKYS